jgi:hypothetical protein
MSVATPSAKSHERVTGRWVRDYEIATRKEWAVYYLKLVLGTPVPWLICAYAFLSFVSRAGVEIAAWATAILTTCYIFVDRFSSSREFSFFRVGGDFFLLGYLIVGIVSAANTTSTEEAFASLSGVRWVFLVYAITYCWELFPGLNRVLSLMVGASCLAAVYGIWQHFTGVDLLAGTALTNAPIPGSVFFLSTSFFNTPEVLGTLLAMTLPFPAAAYLLADRRDLNFVRWTSLAICMLLLLAMFWTYRPGIWMAALIGTIVTILMQGRQVLAFILPIIGMFAAVILLAYPSPDAMLNGVQEFESVRGDRQRQQINTQVQLWQTDQQSLWVGVGRKAMDAANYDPGTGNVYFQVLAQSGLLGAGFYLLFILGSLLATYRIFQEIPRTHYWHRVLISGALASQIAFHVAGLYWSTLAEGLALNLFVLVISAASYLSEHYGRGLVSDDQSL